MSEEMMAKTRMFMRVFVAIVCIVVVALTCIFWSNLEVLSLKLGQATIALISLGGLCWVALKYRHCCARVNVIS